MKAQPYRNYLLFVLSAVAALNIADRVGLGLVLQGIKADLHVSDTELGLLTGIPIACAQSVMGIPIARWTDRGNRVMVIAFTTAVWSGMVALTGSVTTFAQLFLVRIGVGIGDAGISPAAQSLIPDYFMRADRPRATAIYFLAWPAGLMLGYFVAGWVNEFYGRRVMFLWLGFLGLAVTVLAALSLREPRRSGTSKAAPGNVVLNPVALSFEPEIAQASPNHPSLGEVIHALWGNVTFRHLLASYTMISLVGIGILQWEPTFFIRSYQMTTAQVGTLFTLTIGLCSLLSIYAGGTLMSRYAANNERLQLQLMAAGYIGFGVAHALLFLTTNRYLALALLGLANAMSNAASAPVLAAVQTLIAPRMRATSIVILFLVSNLVGTGLGPLLAGTLSDALRPMFREDSLRVSLLCLCPGYAWGAWHMWRASRTVNSDLRQLHQNSDGLDPHINLSR